MNYKKVIEAYDTGEIKFDEWELRIDNDGGYWAMLNSDDIPDKEHDECVREMERKYGTPGGYCDMVEILQQMGVNADWV